MNAKPKKVDLALQGGGSHGAFTWGILDRILESNLFIIDGISAASAGSINAILVAQGMLNNGPEGARELLFHFWKSISEYNKSLSKIHQDVSYAFMHKVINTLSPYQFNLANVNPIKDLLTRLIDFKKIRKSSEIKLFIAATNVQRGKLKIFTTQELKLEMILASICLPKLFKTVKIAGQYYWDGGYLANPALYPLIYGTKTNDIILIHTTPIERTTIPVLVDEIDLRVREITFNATVVREIRAIGFVSELISKGWLKPQYAANLKKVLLHSIKADEYLHHFSLANAFTTDWAYLQSLYKIGRQMADRWIKKNYAALGKTSTINFAEWV